ncbi:phosphatidylglycerophosphatase A family protein [Pseudooceanicola algae]|uniref:Phosphatidylglycerophosphatase A n=1 Tax=Pseudooceanicola algae TaxID=1537215 RepID=A0A418SEI5_9RHOB|nr:phosphatidylglycerophosphatase A [Pseudooceanicola algae]QPM89773.1 hypothetical protein PSAL_009990 [Pseudooceanicola algae]
MKISTVFATLGGIGYLKPASGTWGSLAALPLAWALHVAGGPMLLLLACFAVFLAGVVATESHTARTGDHDPSEVVIDEVVGLWIAFLPVSFGAAHVGASLTALYPGWIMAFLAFRLFDIWKPGPVGWADRRSDAFGVMLDDVIAGVMAAVVVIVTAAFSHLVLM